ncbi:MAG: LamG domain-containing protein [Kiritimatiellia bacterium]|nr:LamG domain-containing protein [Kiritimatiellia bacterium]
MKTKREIPWAIMVALLGTGVCGYATPVFFQDPFTNNTPTQVADESPHHWVAGTTGNSWDGSTLSEAQGRLILTAQNLSGTNQPDANLSFAQLNPLLNFWAKPVSLVISGIERGGNGTNGNEQNLYITVQSKAVNPANQTTAKLEIRIFGSGDSIYAGWHSSRWGHINTWNLVGPSSLNISPLKNGIRDVTLTLDGAGSQLLYDISFTYTGTNSKDTNGDGFVDSSDTGMSALSGALSVSDTAAFKAQWLADNGVSSATDAKAAMALASRRTSGNTAITSVVEIENVQIFDASADPMRNDLEFTDGFDNGIVTQAYLETPHRWVTSTANTSGETSSIEESGGNLVLTAQSSGGSQPEANLRFAEPDGELNFWARPVAIHIQDLELTGTMSSPNFYLTLSAKEGNPAIGGGGNGPTMDFRLAGTTLTWRWTDQANKAHLWSGNSTNFLSATNQVVTTHKDWIKDVVLVLDGTGSQLRYDILFEGRSGYANTLDDDGDGFVDASDARLVGRWKADAIVSGAIPDSTHHGHAGVLEGNPSLVSGKWDRALSLNGSSQRMVVDDVGVNTEVGGYNTVVFWMKWNGVNGRMPFNWSSSYSLFFSGDGFGFNPFQGNVWGISTNELGSGGSWVHVAAVFPNGTVKGNAKLYINGSLKTLSERTTSDTTASKTAASRFCFGARGTSSGSQYYFGGELDDMRVYDRELTATEIGRIFQHNADLSELSGALSEGETTLLRDAWLAHQGISAKADSAAALALCTRRTTTDTQVHSIARIGGIRVYDPRVPIDQPVMNRAFEGARVRHEVRQGWNTWTGEIEYGDWTTSVPRSRDPSFFNYIASSQITSNELMEIIGNRVETALMPWGGAESVLRMSVFDNDPILSSQSRVQLNWHPEADVNEIFFAGYVQIEDHALTHSMAFDDQTSGTSKWRQFIELRGHKNGTTHLRTCVGINSGKTMGPYWYLKVETCDEGQSPTIFTPIYTENKMHSELPIPAGRWILLTAYYRHGQADGAFEARYRLVKEGGGFEGPWRTIGSARGIQTVLPGAPEGISFVNFMKIYAAMNVVDDAMRHSSDGIWQKYSRLRLWTNPPLED